MVVAALYDKTGDLGDVAMELRVKQRTLFQPKPLTVSGVYATLRKIAKLSGTGTTDEKTALVKTLLIAGKGEEIRYLVRTLLANLRIGATKTTSLTALARAVVVHAEWDALTPGQRTKKMQDTVTLHMKSSEATVKEVYARLPNYDLLVSRLLDPEVGLERLAEVCGCVPGVPIKGMLGKITRDLAEALGKIEGREFIGESSLPFLHPDIS
jgi:DNA ligase-1